MGERSFWFSMLVLLLLHLGIWQVVLAVVPIIPNGIPAVMMIPLSFIEGIIIMAAVSFCVTRSRRRMDQCSG